jgi:hypothetical protein
MQDPKPKKDMSEEEKEAADNKIKPSNKSK